MVRINGILLLLLTNGVSGIFALERQIIARDPVNANGTNSTIDALAEDHTVSWQAALWPLIALALNAMLQRSPADNFPSKEALSPARTSVFICLADILVAVMWMVYGKLAGQGFRESARLYRSDMGIFSDENILLEGTPAVGLILFFLVPIPQALKLFGSKGLPGTWTWMLIFLLAYLVGILVNTLGVSHRDKTTKSQPRVVLDAEVRDTLVKCSDLIYAAAYLAQLGVWIWIAAELFESGFVASTEKAQGNGSARLAYLGISVLWLVLCACLIARSNAIAKAAAIPVFVSWVVFVVKISMKKYVTWATHHWNHILPHKVVLFLSVVLCIVIAIAFIIAGVTITMLIDFGFKVLGEAIEGPPAVGKAEKTTNQTPSLATRDSAAKLSSELGDDDARKEDRLSAADHHGSSEADASSSRSKVIPPLALSSPATPEPVHVPFATPVDLDIQRPIPLIRLSKSLHFPLVHDDDKAILRQPSLALEANLFSNKNTKEQQVQERPTADTSSTGHKPTKGGQPCHRLFWDPSEHKTLRRMVSIGFAITNLILAALFYGYKYKSEGTYRAAWTEQIG